MRWVGLLVVLAVSVALAGCAGDDRGGRASADRTSSSTVPQPRVTVAVPEYPFSDDPSIALDGQALDAYATQYVSTTAEPDSERFLFGWLPVEVFDRILRSGDVDGEEPLGILYVSGYFGGVWLRGAIDRAQPGTSALANVRTTPSQEDFAETIELARTALDAATGPDDEALAYAEASLFPRPGVEAGFAGDGLAQGFGYNQGYLLQILEAPPAGLETPRDHQVTCNGPLSCTYASPRLGALRDLAATEAALREGSPPAYSELARRIAAEQDAFVPRGRAVWSGGLSVEGFGQRDYETLLDVSSSFLEALQATALTAARAAAEQDADAGRRAAFANAAMIVWLRAYTTGLVEGRTPPEVPGLTETGG
ncbi:MAG: hypothetical protein KatS3mg010_1757 [Acidimicrobiia bacterium]|nr:MAG: hypothetical protein KatS3mg010_1757 [Acidimicrobiia bacterium]